MKLRIVTKDPLNVLKSTQSVLENAKFVSFNLAKVGQISNLVSDWLARNPDMAEEEFGLTGNFENDLQLIFIEDVVNFCFWAKKDQPKWQLEWPKGNLVSGGWFGLVACFQRGLAEKIPILDPKFLSEITIDQAKSFFRGSNNIEIPLLKERVANLREAGLILTQKYDRHFINVIDKAKNNAITLVKIICQDFRSFNDYQKFNGKRVFFFKRAQICANDISYVLERNNQEPLKNINLLTAFADYKLPQILRLFGLLKYHPDLAKKIDNYVLIPQGSREEIEIRAVTIWGVELIRQRLKIYTARQIDHALWFISQDKSTQEKPYHRTRTMYY
jgi:hypothetical protein